MGKATSVGGWVVALTLLAATAYLYRVNQDLNARLSASNDERKEILVQVEAQSDQNMELSEMIGKLSQGLDETQARLQQLEEATRDMARRRTGFSSFEELGEGIGATLGELGAIVDLIVSGQAVMIGNPFVDLITGLVSEDTLEAVARATVNMRYGDFIGGLDLDETRRAEVEDAFIQGTRAQIKRASSSFFTGEASDEEPEDTDVDVLREHLAQVLTQEELNRFDASQSDLRERNIRRNFRVQLRIFAAGLTPENLEHVLNVLVEESLKAFDEDGTAPPSGLDFRGQLDMQKTVYPRALERLRDDLDAEQFAVFERFVDNQLALLETSSRLLRGLFGDRAEEQDPQ